MEIELFRDGTEKLNYGKLFVDGKYLGETLEDPEREVKIDGDTAIPIGRYKITLTFSNRFKKIMPYLHDVPGFDGVRVHGGNYSGHEIKYVTINRDILKAAFFSVEYVDVYDDKEKG